MKTKEDLQSNLASIGASSVNPVLPAEKKVVAGMNALGILHKTEEYKSLLRQLSAKLIDKGEFEKKLALLMKKLGEQDKIQT